MAESELVAVTEVLERVVAEAEGDGNPYEPAVTLENMAAQMRSIVEQAISTLTNGGRRTNPINASIVNDLIPFASRDYALSVVEDVLTTKSDWLRLTDALEWVADLQLVQAAELVRPFLRHRNEIVRAQAAQALGMIGDTRSLPALVAVSSDPRVRVRASALLARSLLGDVAGDDFKPGFITGDLLEDEADFVANSIEYFLLDRRMGASARSYCTTMLLRVRERIAEFGRSRGRRSGGAGGPPSTSAIRPDR